MLVKEAIRAAVIKLEAETKSYYQSANEALYTSIAYAVVSFATFSFLSVIIPAVLIPVEGLRALFGFGGGGTASSITIAWGLRERLDRRDKARQLEAQKKSLQTLTQVPELCSEAQQAQIVTAVLELTLRTISAPYESSRDKTQGTGK